MKLSLAGKRTLLCCAVILVLALCQGLLKIDVPEFVWLSLFAAALAFLRLGLPPGAAPLLLIAPAAAALLAGCITVHNNVGDYAIRMAAAGRAELDATNALASASAATNAVESAGAARLRGGLILSTSINKNVSPSTSTALQYMP